MRPHDATRDAAHVLGVLSSFPFGFRGKARVHGVWKRISMDGFGEYGIFCWSQSLFQPCTGCGAAKGGRHDESGIGCVRPGRIWQFVLAASSPFLLFRLGGLLARTLQARGRRGEEIMVKEVEGRLMLAARWRLVHSELFRDTI